MNMSFLLLTVDPAWHGLHMRNKTSELSFTLSALIQVFKDCVAAPRWYFHQDSVKMGQVAPATGTTGHNKKVQCSRVVFFKATCAHSISLTLSLHLCVCSCALGRVRVRWSERGRTRPCVCLTASRYMMHLC